MVSICRVWILVIFLPDVNSASENEYNPCSDITCHHDNQEVCGVRLSIPGEVAYRLFRDKCDLIKYECREGKKGFKLIDIKYCKRVFPPNDDSYTFGENSNIQDEETRETTQDLLDVTDTRNTTEYVTCIHCDCNTQSETICAIREEGDHFIIREFADECHMLQYNCEQHSHFSVTDKYICDGNENSSEKAEENAIEPMSTDVAQNTKSTESATLHSKCIQNDCIRNYKVTCAASLEDKRFVVRWFHDECDMLQYNCEKSVNFFLTDDSLCVKYDNLIKNITSEDGIRNITDISDSNGNAIEIDEYGDEKEIDFIKDNTIQSAMPNLPKNVVVSTYDFTENINQTAANFFAASHSMGIPLEKLNDQTRRVIIHNTGPVNVFVPRTFIPANFTPVGQRPATEQKYYKPLLKYCYHRCPEKCPDIYEPVCAANTGEKNYIPYVIFKNHCYMDIAKCKISWAGYSGHNITDFEAMGFIFCAGSKFMNAFYTFPIIKILQKMGRVKKKAQLRFIMRNLGHFPYNVKG